MPTITPDSLLSLEEYAKRRPDLRRAAIEKKNIRKIFVGENVMLQFEDEETIRYQIQEMLRVEKTFEQEGIREELEAYNPLIPDGHNWKATMMIEFTDVDERQKKLVELKGIERKTYMQVGDLERVYAIADEDMPRENEEKTSAVHFMRFELSHDMIKAVKAGEPVAAGVDHPAYTIHVDEINPQTQASLTQDLH
ncbi:MAG: DUF3501 family protein [Gammaproteobacteria bacterium]|nr:DUF3501 family protein [Gammaproteobacteria bacterium]NND39992.1 DUF3501 family protein [Pseudomonadales bacterium]MBT8151338.1 DUF3501 family protein [Gammaproteobacteria bacterium]NNL11930.1 DUF3501 family protein [Pseudomonadales bacterium]NNM12121.1 DUF3501 family protein [Pseudomonadales bacterium]